ncbi:MAG: RNA polymerase sigma factor [Candidatus Azobacteroides sp.]|nr:RNA polymerase sigma factor [Candidatus Azobacteroides sp.]
MEQAQFKKEVLPLRERLILYAERLLENKSDAEDIIQEVFFKLWSMRDELSNYKSVDALSITMTKHLCLNRLKANKREREDLNGIVLMDDNLSPDEQLEQKDSVTQVIRIIDRLPGLQQAILRMKHIEGLEIDEIAALTGSAPEAVRMNLSRARKKVKELFFKNDKQWNKITKK